MNGCPDEREVQNASRAGAWARELELHVESCSRCRELLEVSRWMNRFARFTHAMRLPDPNRIWVEAQLRQRRAAYRAGLRPVRLLHLFMYAIAALGPTSWIAWNWARVSAWAADLGKGHLSWPTDPAIFLWTFAWLIFGVFGVVALMTLPWILAEE